MNGGRHRPNSLAPCALLLATLASPAAADWAESPDPLAVRVRPAASAQVRQNPPGFAWNRAPGRQAYEVSLRHADGSSRTWRSGRNWLLPAEALPAGNYVWRVRQADGGNWSDPRHFTLPPDATPFPVPEDDVLVAKLLARQRPRGLPVGSSGEAEWRSETLRVRTRAVAKLEAEVRSQSSRPLIEGRLSIVPHRLDPAAWAKSLFAVRSQVAEQTRQLRAAALAWHLTRNPEYRAEALRRGDALAALDPQGATGHEQQDQANRDIAWALAEALDRLDAEVAGLSRTRWRTAILSRTEALFNDLIGSGRRIEQAPFDSHGATNLGYLAAISVLMLGEVPRADAWLRGSFRSHANYLSPWGGEEGGFANGSAYAEYAVDFAVPQWDAIQAATGVNLYDKPWSRGMVRFFAFFVPPGSPSHVFGDAAEARPNAAVLKRFASRFADSGAAWYVRNLIGEEDPLSLLAAPLPLPSERVVALPPATDSIAFHSIGWVAMHSSLADRSRSSIYFKSSAFGAYNHSHLDQNSLTVVAAGKPLLVDSGVYDWYGSRHWSGWYRRTQAHNAITFDGGQGQQPENADRGMAARGRLLDVKLGGETDSAEGDATAAYGGALTRARRKVWYLREADLVVVRDSIASPVPRIFEWNLHALAPPSAGASGGVELAIDGVRLCIDMLAPSGLRFVADGEPPDKPENRPAIRQWHAHFQPEAAQREMVFVATLRPGCRGDRPVLERDPAGAMSIRSGERTLMLE
jgi:hypothetical protein